LILQVRPLDMTSCAASLSLYLSDAANCRILRVDAVSGQVLDSWRVEAGRAWGVSVTAGGNVVVCCRGHWVHLSFYVLAQWNIQCETKSPMGLC